MLQGSSVEEQTILDETVDLPVKAKRLPEKFRFADLRFNAAF